MKFNYKSRKGFTLIELLVVIGILAVLAAIAIPSVAGLIDRANQSSDATNSNEMTNAIERFTSEYELYKQDIASGVIKNGQTSGFDSAQGRVYNVTKVTSRSGIENLEKDTNAGPNTTGRAIYRDTKYPVNAETTKAIIENYTKTSSSTFEPKQSDKHFWYSPECGVVIVADANSSVKDKNDMIISGMDAKGNELNDDETNGTIWINLTTSIESQSPATPSDSLNHNSIIPMDGIYRIYATGETLNPGSPFPATIGVGDTYTYGEYVYTYGSTICKCPNGAQIGHSSLECGSGSINGWNAMVINKTQSKYGTPLKSINNAYLTDMSATYSYCTSLTDISEITIHNTVTCMNGTFAFCQSLSNISSLTIPNSVTIFSGAFLYCTSLQDASSLVIPSSVTDMRGTFEECSNLKYAPDLSQASGLKGMNGTFQWCDELIVAPVIPANVEDLGYTFDQCPKLSGTITVNANPSSYENFIYNTQVTQINGSTSLKTELLATKN